MKGLKMPSSKTLLPRTHSTGPKTANDPIVDRESLCYASSASEAERALAVAIDRRLFTIYNATRDKVRPCCSPVHGLFRSASGRRPSLVPTECLVFNDCAHDVRYCHLSDQF